jgi:predicted MPP superfamily phosphohydrolase
MRGLDLRGIGVALPVAIGVVCASAVYAHYVEPAWIEVSHLEVAAPNTPRIKIAHLTDLHVRGQGRTETRLLELLDQEKPDLIVITGDTVSRRATPRQIREFYARLHAPLGVYFVRGNWENRSHAGRPPSNVTVLSNQSAKVRDDLYVVGLDDMLTGKPDLAAALKDVPPEAYKIALFHSPGFFPQVAGQVQLALAGHTHGGQVRIPFVPPVWTPAGSGPFVHGWYEQGDSRLYVSRGIGMSFIPIRFLCRPELAIITLVAHLQDVEVKDGRHH